jgi:hypothetical protein
MLAAILCLSLSANSLRSRFDAYEVCYASSLCVKTGFASCF